MALRGVTADTATGALPGVVEGRVREVVAEAIPDLESPIGAALSATIDEVVVPLRAEFAGLSLGVGMVSFTDSLGSYGDGWLNYVAVNSKQQIRNLGIYAHPGYDTLGLLPLVGEVTSTDADLVGVQCLTNDANAGGGTALSGSFTRYAQIVDAIREAGKTPVLFTPPPLAGANAARGRQCVDFVRRYARLNRLPLIDVYTLLTAPGTGVFKAGFDVGDGIHYTNVGVAAVAAEVVRVLGPMLAPAPVLTALADGSPNLFVSTALLSDSNIDGILDTIGQANDYPKTGLAYSSVASAAPDPLGFNWQRMTLSSNANGSFALIIDAPSPGHRVMVACRVRSTGQGTVVRCTGYTAGYGVTSNIELTPNVPDGASQPLDGVLYAEFVVADGTALIGLQLIGNPTAVAAGNGTYDLALPTLIDLTAAGIA